MLVKNEALIMSVNDPRAILAAMPHAKYIKYKGRNLVVCKHTLDNAKVLRNLGLDAPGTINYQYQYTGRYAPLPKQRVTADFFTLNNRAYCFNEMRTGKTGAALWAADSLLKTGYMGKILVVCPVDVMAVWVGEGFSMVPHRTVIQVRGSKEKRISLLREFADFHVINFDGLSTMYHEERDERNRIKRKWSELEGMFDHIIVDEADAYCNATNTRWKALNQLIKPDTGLWLLTGTPTPNAPTDSYGLIKLMQPWKVPNNYKVFEEQLMKPVGPYKKVPRDGAQEAVNELMQPAIRFERDQSEFPTTVQNRETVMSKTQEAAFDAMKAEMAFEAQGVGVTAANAAVKLIKLQQIMCGAVKDDDGNIIDLDGTPRLAEVERLVRQAGKKTVVYIPFKASMYKAAEYLNTKGFATQIVNGDVSKSERERIIAAFKNDPSCRVLIAHPKVASYGIDLTCSDTFIWFAPTFSTVLYQQACARGEGVKKDMSVGIYHIGCHPVEWRIYDVLQGKVAMQNKLLDLYQFAIGA
jgi:SNF2 family DNA or RNA helicase